MMMGKMEWIKMLCLECMVVLWEEVVQEIWVLVDPWDLAVPEDQWEAHQVLWEDGMHVVLDLLWVCHPMVVLEALVVCMMAHHPLTDLDLEMAHHSVCVE